MVFAHNIYTCWGTQDTKRLLQEEATSLHAELQRRDAAARLSAVAAKAEELAVAGDLGRLQEQLAATEAKLDRTKQVGGVALCCGATGDKHVTLCGSRKWGLCAGSYSCALTHVHQHKPLCARSQMFYFPDAEGFRFRGGGGGIFFAAKDLHVAGGCLRYVAA